MFAPDALGMHLADLGADVIKVERPGIGDPARLLGRPYRGESVATRRWNRGKRSLALDLGSDEGRDVFKQLVARCDAVIEGMRPGAMSRNGVGFEDLLEVNPRLVFASLSGWGQGGPYRELASHGLAFDAYAGLAPPRRAEGRVARPSGQVWAGLEAGPLYAALAVVSGILRARATGQPAAIEVSQADAGAVWNGWRIAYEAALAAHGSESEDAERADYLASMASAADAGGEDLSASDVRYQYYEARDGTILLMATETKFWENFCRGVGRMDLFERWPGQPGADHDYGNDALRDELTAVFATRTRREWIDFFIAHDVAGGPVYDASETAADPHFDARGLWTDPTLHGVRILGSPIRCDGRPAVASIPSPRAGQQSGEVLQELLGYDDDRIASLRARGVLGEER